MPIVTDVTAPLAAEVDALCELDPAQLSDGDAVVALHRQLARLEAVVTRAVAAFDAGGSWEADGARSAASWVGVRCNLPSALARKRIREGRELRSMPHVQTAWAAGDLNQSHVSLLVGARNRNPECFARDEELLVGEAKALPYRHFVRALAYWAQLADPDGAEERAAQNYDKRDFSFSQGWEGCWFPDGMVDPIGGAIVDQRLGCIYDELFRADWAEAKARVGEGVCLADLARTPAQRRHDALVEMARRAGAVPERARMPEPLFSVVIDLTSLKRTCELWNGTVVTPGQLVRYLDDAWVERLVYDGPSRVIDVGVRRRFFTGGTRRAIEVRDRECAHEFCDLAADRCDIDHVKPFSEGGLTTTDNGRPECGWHNRWKDMQRRRGPPAA